MAKSGPAGVGWLSVPTPAEPPALPAAAVRISRPKPHVKPTVPQTEPAPVNYPVLDHSTVPGPLS